jgi:hypothetical protein
MNMFNRFELLKKLLWRNFGFIVPFRMFLILGEPKYLSQMPLLSYRVSVKNVIFETGHQDIGQDMFHGPLFSVLSILLWKFL